MLAAIRASADEKPYLEDQLGVVCAEKGSIVIVLTGPVDTHTEGIVIYAVLEKLVPSPFRTWERDK